MKKLLTYIVLSILVVAPFAQSLAQNRQRFDGGMMVHSGYLHGDLTALNHKAEGMTFGLGGVLRYHLGNHFRLGGEGYVSTLKQMHNGSYIRTSWGGLLADAYWRFGRWQPYAGVTIGGGKASSLLMFEGSADDWEAESDAFLHKESFFFVNPNIGVEFALTETVHLTLKVDRLIPVSSIEMPTGVRCYLGFVFVH
ncbi:MAG: outer membrane beta-barrel protein [bacterium]|nr:outer membrane beta-barrel protein [bacterium]